MITTLAKVVETAPNHVLALCQKTSSCAACAAKASCSVDLLSKAMASKSFIIKVPTDKSIAVGSIIEIGVAEDILLNSARLIYLLPLVFAIAVALIADLFTHNEAVVIFASFAAGVLGFRLAKIKTVKLESQLDNNPSLLRIISYGKTNSRPN